MALLRRLRRSAASRHRKLSPGARAGAYRVEPLEPRVLLSADLITLPDFPDWVSLGPGGITSPAQPKPASGAIHAVAFDSRTDPLSDDGGTIYVGSVNGGVWKTGLTLGGDVKGWIPLTDQEASLSISALALDSDNPDVVFAGTGKVSAFNEVGASVGILRSLKGGEGIGAWDLAERYDDYSPTLPRPGAPRGFRDADLTITAIAPHEGSPLVLASARGDDPAQVSLLKSKDGGDTWETVRVADGSGGFMGFPTGSVTDLVVDPRNPNIFYAGLASGDPATAGVYQILVGLLPGTTADYDVRHFQRLPAGIALPEDSDGVDNNPNKTHPVPPDEIGEGLIVTTRIRLSVSAAEHRPVYAAFLTTDSEKDETRLSALFQLPKSLPAVDLGTGSPNVLPDWVRLGNVNLPAKAPTTEGQGDTHFSLVADPENPNVVYMGGDTYGVLSAGELGEVGAPAVFRGTILPNLVFPLNAQWTNISGSTTATSPHVDSRSMVFDSLRHRILQVDDGGIYRLSFPDENAFLWESLNAGLELTEFTSIAYDRRLELVVGGTQDNGVVWQTPSTDRVWRKIMAGDGGFVDVFNHDDAAAASIYYYSSQRLGTFSRREAPSSDALRPTKIVPRLDPVKGDPAVVLRDVFRPPVVANLLDPKRLLIATHSLYESKNGRIFNRVQEEDASRAGFPHGAVVGLVYGGMARSGVDAKPEPDLIYAARKDVLLLREPGKSSLRPVPIPGISGDIEDVAIHPFDWRKVAVLTHGEVWITPDASAKDPDWLAIRPRRSTPDLRVSDFETIAWVAKEDGFDAIFVGGLGGVITIDDPIGVAIEFPSPSTPWRRADDPLDPKLPRAVVMDLRYDAKDDVLIAGTLGRGAWKLPDASSVIGGGTLQIRGTDANDVVLIGPASLSPRLLQVHVLDENSRTLDFKTIEPTTVREIFIDLGAGNDDRVELNFGTHDRPFLPPTTVSEAVDRTHLLMHGGERLALDVGSDDPTANEFAARVTGGGHETVVVSLTVGAGSVVWEGGSLGVSLQRKNAVLRHGIEYWAGELLGNKVFPSSAPAIGATGNVADGVNVEKARGVSDEAKEGGDEVILVPVRRSSEFLRRMIEEGPNGFPISAIGSEIDSLEKLRERLDALDATPGNVTLVDGAEEARLDVRIEGKALAGTADLDFTAADGAIDLFGQIDLAFDVDLHAILGVDAHGFFLDAEGNPDPEIVVRNARVVGETIGTGRVGFLEVEVVDGQFSFDEKLKLEIDLHDPGTVAEDGRIRLDELEAIGNDLVTTKLVGNPAADDVFFTGTFAVAAAFSESEAPFELGDLRVAFRWPDVNEPLQVEFSAAPGSEGERLLEFLNVGVEHFVEGLSGLAAWLQGNASEGALGAELPLAGKSLGEVLAGLAERVEIPDALALDDASVTVSAVVEEGFLKRFDVTAAGVDFVAAGVERGSPVSYTDDAGIAVEGVVDAVEADRITVAFDAVFAQTPHPTAPGFEIGLLVISDVEPAGEFERFTVLAPGSNPLPDGVKAGNQVFYKDALGNAVQGEIEEAFAGGFTVRFAAALDQTPHPSDPGFEIVRPGTLLNQLSAFLGPLSEPETLSVEVPSLQELLRRLALHLGVDEIEDVQLTGAGAGLAVQIPLSFDVDPMSFHQALDFGAGFPGLELDSQAELSLAIDPKIDVVLGVRLGADVPLEERLFFGAAGTKLTLGIQAGLDTPDGFDAFASGRVGFLDVGLREQNPASEGITLAGSIGLQLVDPGTDAAADGRVTLAELFGDPLGSFDSVLDLELDIDPLVLSAAVEGSTLGSLTISLDGATEGKVASLDDLADLPQRIFDNVEGNLAGFLDFSNITPEMILAALEALVEQLRALGAGGVVDTRLPLVNRSFADLVDLGQAFHERFAASGGESLLTASGLEDYLNARLDGDPASDLVQVSVAPGEIRFAFEFQRDFDPEPIAFALGLEDGLGLVTVDAHGGLDASAEAILHLALGIRSDDGLALADRIFLGTAGDEEIRLTASLAAGYDTGAAPLAFAASVGPVEVAVPEGHALLQASLALDLQDGDGRLTLAEIAAKAAAGDFGGLFASSGLSGTAQAYLPLVAETTSATIEVAGRLENLESLVFDLDPPDPLLPAPLAADQFDAAPLDEHFLIFATGLDELVASLFDFSSLLDGLETFLRWGQELLGLDVLDFRLPFVGHSLADAFDFFDASQEGALGLLVADLRAAAANGGRLEGNLGDVAIAETARALRDILLLELGVTPIGDTDGDGVDADDLLRIERGTDVTPVSDLDVSVALLPTTPELFEVTTATEDFLQVGRGVAVGDVVHYAERVEASGPVMATGVVKEVAAQRLIVEMDDPSAPPIVQDFADHFTIDTRNIVGVAFLARIVHGVSRTEPLDFALDFLDLRSSEAEATFSGDLELRLGFGIDRRGFFVTTDFAGLVDELGQPIGGGEIALTGGLELAGQTLPLELGFLDLDALLAGALTASFEADLASGSDPGKLRLAELLDLGAIASQVDFALGVEAHAAARLSVAAGSELPALRADLVFDWGVADAAQPDGYRAFDVVSEGVPDPVLRLENVGIDAGSFLTQVVKPLFQRLEQWNPLGPLAELVDLEIPIIGGTPLELLLPLVPEGARPTLELLLDVFGTLDELDFDEAVTGGNGLLIPFGSIEIGGTGTDAVATPDPDVEAAEAARDTATDASGRTIPGSGLPVIGELLEALGEDLGITFPVLRVANLAQLLVGKDVDLAFAELSRLEVEKRFSVSIPILSYGVPMIAEARVEVFFGGGIGLQADISLGFDTRGLRGDAPSFLDGLYLGDFAPGSDGQIGPGDEERPEVALEATLFAGIDAGAFLGGFKIASVVGEAAIIGRLTVDWNDDNAEVGPPLDPRSDAERSDGRFHIDEIQRVFAVHGGNELCLFDLGGELVARISGTVKVPIFSDPKFSMEWVLADFSLGCEPGELEIDLAYLQGDALVLTSTTGAGETDLLSRAATNHPDGDVVRILLVDADGNEMPETLRVEKNGFFEDFGPGEGGANHLASLGDLSRITDADPGLVGGLDRSQLDGFGAGPDVVTVDPGIAILVELHGQDGDDVLVGGSGGATLVGGAGNDQLELAGGFAYLVGGGGDDLLTGAGNGDRLVGDYDGNLHLPIRIPAEGSDQIDGRGGFDRIWGDNRAEDDDGHDGPLADASRATRDTIAGGGGNDRIFAGTDDDHVEGDEIGGLAGANPGADLVFGGPGDDALFGAAFNDILVGEAGDDRIEAGTGDDALYGGNQTLGPDASDQGADHLVGGEGDDLLDGSDSSFVVGFGGSGDDVLLGSRGADTLFGETGRDFLVAGPNNDAVEGGEGDDDLVGGKGSAGGVEFPASVGPDDGADRLLGGDGDDVILADGGAIDPDLRSAATSTEGGAGSDFASGDAGNDLIFGGGLGDLLVGGSGRDIVVGDQGSRTSAFVLATASSVAGSSGDDDLRGGDDADLLIGGDGADRIAGDADDDVLIGDLAVIRLAEGDAIERIETAAPETGGADALSGGDGVDVLAGGARGDLLHGGADADILLGDEALLDWLYGGDPAFAAIEAGFVFDASLATLDLVATQAPRSGGRDTLFGDAGADLLFGGTDADLLFGDDGGDEGPAAGADDILFGDHGRVYPQHSALPTFPSRNFFASDTGDADGGEGDRLFGEEGDDLLLGQQGDDRLFGGAGDDDLVGGHNVAGGVDELSAPAVEASRNPAVNDLLDGGTGDDALAGDNATIWRQAQRTSPRFRSLEGDRLYRPDDGAPAVGADPRLDPRDAVGRAVTLLDHAAGLEGATGARLFGDDLLAGGADHDLLFGELGADVLHGDGAIGAPPGAAPGFEVAVEDAGEPTSAETLFFAQAEAAGDGDDYVEGGGGDDRIYGGLGQDDLIGGSSSLFGLATPALRPDGSDAILGGAGTRTARDDPGDPSAEGHARDADAILGDNGNLYRIVGANGTDAGSFLSFVHDDYSASLRIVPRAALLLDYTPGGADYAAPAQAGDLGAADEVHGESGDDSVHGMKGDDVLFGDGQDDDLIGGYGRDWISGGTGRDGILGDDGRIATSRNGTAGEPLYGIAGLAPAELDLRISTPGNHQQATINATGELKKQVDLTPFHLSPAGQLGDVVTFDPVDADDILYGGLGGDWVHGGSGDDAISGAEALPGYYAAPANPGDVLDYGGVQAGEFAAYDENDPWRKVLVGGQEFLLNFSATEGSVDPRSALGRTTDGDDRLFGDLGNDWLVGGTGRDHLYGGLGDDLLNADDDHDTSGGANDAPDTDASYEDRAYGGGGRDVLIGNTGGDRLIDWVGEWNSYVVPFSPFGVSTVSRTLQPQLPEYLYALSRSDGADATRAADASEDPARNGEPFGELGLVIQRDPFWQGQTGGPADPQPGNNGGQQREVLRSVSFDSGAPAGVAIASGTWTVEQGRYVGAMERLAADLNGDGVVGAPDYALLLDRAFGTRAAGHPADLNLDGAVGGPDLAFLVRQLGRRAAADVVSVLDLEVSLPRHFELEATLRLGTEAHANGYLIFDYQGPEEFRFAGLDALSQTLRIGSRDAQGWHVLAEQALPVERGRDYRVLLSVNGLVAALAVDGVELASHAFVARRSADGAPEGLETGRLGVGSQRATVALDDLEVRAPWLGTFFEHVEDFADGAAPRLDGPQTGGWIVEAGRLRGAATGNQDSAITTFDLSVGAMARLELESTLAPESLGGFFFAYQGNRDWSFAALLPDTQQVVIGHATQQGIAYDAVADLDPAAGPDYELRLSLVGSTVSVSVDGHEVLGHGFAAGATTGGFGLLSAGGATSFDRLAVRTDDEAAVAAAGAGDFAMRLLAVDHSADEDDPEYVITEIPLAGV